MSQSFCDLSFEKTRASITTLFVSVAYFDACSTLVVEQASKYATETDKVVMVILAVQRKEAASGKYTSFFLNSLLQM